jgi:hypothetical protein
MIFDYAGVAIFLIYVQSRLRIKFQFTPKLFLPPFLETFEVHFKDGKGLLFSYFSQRQT